MAFIVVLYILLDVLLHKGQLTVMLPKTFPAFQKCIQMPLSGTVFSCEPKTWTKAVNTIKSMENLSSAACGFECDVYFNASKKIFQVYHDSDKNIGLDLEALLQVYFRRKLQACIWLDIKNLREENVQAAVAQLNTIREKYQLHHKIIAESPRADLLKLLSDRGYFTVYYTPMFNPFQMTDTAIQIQVSQISQVLLASNVHALSGYYFQYPFLKQYFPNYPILVWAANDRYSLINRLFAYKVKQEKSIFVVLFP